MEDDGALPEVLRDPHVRVPVWYRLTILIAGAAAAIAFLITDTGPARWMHWTGDFRLEFLLTLLACLTPAAGVLFVSAYVWPKDPREPRPPPRAIARDRRR